MERENKVPSLIISILSLVVLGFILFMSVYNQIMSQSDGFFNMIIFAGILLLVFVLISLIVKLMAVSPTGDYSPILKYLFFAIAIGLAVLCFFLKSKYSTSVTAEESVYYRASEYIYDNMLPEGNDVIPDMLYGSSAYAFVRFTSIFFSFFGVEADLVFIINYILLVLCAFFTFLSVYEIADEICAFISFVAIIFIPGNNFATYSYSPDLYFSALFIITTYLFVLLINKRFKSVSSALIVGIIAGIFSGLLIFSNPVAIIPVVVYIIWAFIKVNAPAVCLIPTPVLMLGTYLGFSFEKSYTTGCTISDIIGSFPKAFNPFTDYILDKTYTVGEVFKFFFNYIDDINHHIVNNYYFLTGENGETYSALQAVWLQLGNQLTYMFLIIMSVACIIYLIKAKIDRITPIFSVFISAFIVQFIEAKSSPNVIYFGMILVIIACTTIQHMFLNHHPDVAEKILRTSEANDNSLTDENDDENDQDSEFATEEDILRARAVAFFGENDALYEQIKEERRNAKMSDSVAATKIRTGFLDGKYVSKEEDIEYFDEIDEPVEIKAIPQIKAIPGTRPVEVVKPVAAEDFDTTYKSDETNGIPSDTDLGENIESEQINNVGDVNIQEMQDSSPEEYYFDEEDEKPRTEVELPLKNDSKNDSLAISESNGGEATEFVFRKRDKSDKPSSESSSLADNSKKSKKDTNKDLKQEKLSTKEQKKLEKEAKKAEKEAEKLAKKNKTKKSEDIKDNKDTSKNNEEKAKPGEHLHNPLPLPKPHVAKDLDFDVNVTDDDDFDY